MLYMYMWAVPRAYFISESHFTKEEFLTYYKNEHEALYDLPLDEFEVELLELEFEMLDADQSGTVTYDEFFKHRTMKVLRQRKPVCTRVVS